MSSTYSKRGYRKAKILKQKNLNKAFNNWQHKVNHLRNIALNLYQSSVDVTEENINEHVRPYLNRDVDSMETLLILGTIEQLKIQNGFKPE